METKTIRGIVCTRTVSEVSGRVMEYSRKLPESYRKLYHVSEGTPSHRSE
ncbi:MAG: hypothetical protein HYY37_06125 [Candidatus Aenigmarchaeota archaeon]|nr:hypothetical protein [Candidatus Aenigmarchaeota archaeon]